MKKDVQSIISKRITEYPRIITNTIIFREVLKSKHDRRQVYDLCNSEFPDFPCSDGTYKKSFLYPLDPKRGLCENRLTPALLSAMTKAINTVALQRLETLKAEVDYRNRLIAEIESSIQN